MPVIRQERRGPPNLLASSQTPLYQQRLVVCVGKMHLMGLAAEYRQQFGWRSWKLVLAEVPLRPGQTILDLGCGVGDQARELAARGCKVIAAGAGHDEVVRLLVERGARLDLKDILWQATPADWARHGGRTAIEAYLRAQDRGSEKQE